MYESENVNSETMNRLSVAVPNLARSTFCASAHTDSLGTAN